MMTTFVIGFTRLDRQGFVGAVERPSLIFGMVLVPQCSQVKRGEHVIGAHGLINKANILGTLEMTSTTQLKS
jgi:hypothetical protein